MFLFFSLYRKYGVIGQKKPEIKYVVAKKSSRGAGRSAGEKGPYKVVDKRLKKDKRAAKSRGKANKNKQSNRKGHKQQKGGKTNNRKKRS